MLSVLESGGGIYSTGDVFTMLELNGSGAFSKQYSRGRENIYHIIENIFFEEVKAAIQDEIKTTLISERGVDYYYD